MHGFDREIGSERYFIQLYLLVQIFLICSCLNLIIRCKKIHETRHIFPGFSRTFIELFGFKVQLALPQGNFSIGKANPEIKLYCLVTTADSHSDEATDKECVDFHIDVLLY